MSGGFSSSTLQLGSSEANGVLLGGDVALDRSGTVITRGDHAAAVAIQSIGGGGGTFVGTTNNFVKLGAVGTTGIGSNLSGGLVSAQTTGAGFFTEGRNSPAFVAQSIGGGGGMVGLSQGGVLLGSRNSSGRQLGGDVVISSNADLNTLGMNSAGLVGQSIGGGGGYSTLSNEASNSDAIVLGNANSTDFSVGCQCWVP